MKKLFFIVTILLTGLVSSSQTVIQMKRQGGVSIIPCKVNGLRLSFIFDTGASDVTISLTEALFMLKNGYLNSSDITGKKSYYSDANGDLSAGEIINLREIDIQGLKLYNVKASIVTNLNAPLLLGQTAINKLGVVQLDLNTNTLTILNSKNNKTTDFENNRLICQDFDGNKYKTIRINDQVWMAENLNVSHYSNGDEILNIVDKNIWSNVSIGAWCYFNNDINIGKDYAKLYNWYAVTDSRNICPVGWKMPTKNDFLSLIYNLGGDTNSAIMLKEIGIKYWNTDLGTNISGFSARGGDWRGGDGIFYYWVKHCGQWWTSSREYLNKDWDINHPWFLTIDSYRSKVTRDPYFSKNAGASVRCIKE